MISRQTLRAAAGAAAMFPALLVAEPVDRSELEQLRAQVRQLEEQVKALTRQVEGKAQNESPPSEAHIALTDRSYTLASADNANAIKFRGLVQLDSRLFFADGGGVNNNAFLLRRARLISEGTFAKNFGYQLGGEFGGGSVAALDANLSVAVMPELNVRIGRFKQPIALERLQSEAWTTFAERALVTNLVPNRDLGLEAFGALAGGRLNYAAGVFNGLPDGADSTNADLDNDKDFAGRVMAAPFKTAAESPLQGLSFGLGGSVGRQKGAAGRTAAYRTDGQQIFFAYNPAVIADGATWRLSPQFEYRRGSFGAIGEYAISAANLRATPGAPKTEIRNHAWQFTAGYVLTGEESTENGVVPRENFDWASRTWGAFEIVGRYAQLQVDAAAFPALASPGSNADAAKAAGLGLNWYLSKVVRFTFDYYQTRFGFSALAPAVPSAQILRQDEKAFISRFQLSF